MAPFRLADFADVRIEPFATDSVPLPEPGDNTYKSVIEMLPRVGEELAVSLRAGSSSRSPWALSTSLWPAC